MERAEMRVLAFTPQMWEPMLRSRVMEALEAAAGPDWQRVVTPVD
jgi:hypothetical protein